MYLAVFETAAKSALTDWIYELSWAQQTVMSKHNGSPPFYYYCYHFISKPEVDDFFECCQKISLLNQPEVIDCWWLLPSFLLQWWALFSVLVELSLNMYLL